MGKRYLRKYDDLTKKYDDLYVKESLVLRKLKTIGRSFKYIYLVIYIFLIINIDLFNRL